MTTQNLFKGMRRALAALVFTGAVEGYSQPALDAAWTSVTGKNKYTTSGGSLFNDCTVIQNDTGVAVNGVSADIFTNFVTKTRDRNEHDFTLSKTYTKGDFSITPSVAVWTLPHSAMSDPAIAGLSIASKKPILGLDVKLSALKAWAKESRGTTIDLSLSKGTKLTDKLSAGVNYTSNANVRFYTNDSGIMCNNLGIYADYKLSPAITLSAGVKRQFHNPSFNGGGSYTIFQLGTSIDLLKVGGKSK